MKQEDKRLALIIGISDYDHAGKLKNPKNDAISMDEVLKKLGFDTIVSINPSYKDLKETTIEFGNKLAEYTTGLFYFAGHGIQVNGVNFLVAKDSNPQKEDQVEFDCLNANLVLSIFANTYNQNNFIFLDACRNNPFERSWHRSPSVLGLSYMNAPYGTLISYSTAPGMTASDGEGDNGLFTSVLIPELYSPMSTIIQVLQKVRAQVIKLSNSAQVPWESTSLISDYVFNDKRYFSLETFCDSVMYSERDEVLNHFNLHTYDLIRVSRLPNGIHETDREDGVIEAYSITNKIFFDLFDGLEYRVYKNGLRKYDFYTVVKNPKKVIRFSKRLFNKIGYGLYDEERVSSFVDEENIRKIAKGKAKTSKEQCFSGWIYENSSLWLKYLNEPDRQLVLTVDFKPSKKVVGNTLLQYFTFDVKSALKNAVLFDTQFNKDSILRVYDASLPDLLFGFFDSVTIREIEDNRSKNVSINISLYSKNDSSPNEEVLTQLTAKLADVYGADEQNDGYLTALELDNLKDGRYWSGRSYHLNEQHQLWDLESYGESCMYGFMLNYYDDNHGIELSIIGYDSLYKYHKTVNS